MAALDTATLRAALAGYQQQLDAIHTRVAEIRSALGVKTAASANVAPVKPKRRMSAAGRAGGVGGRFNGYR
jgi:hypothetical protein